jgi:hypothetical protein
VLLLAGAGLSFAHTASAGDCSRVAAQLKQDPRIEILDTRKGMIFAAHTFGGGMNISCFDDEELGGPTDLVVGLNSSSPSQEFLAFFGNLAQRVTGVKRDEALAAVLHCHKSALDYKRNASGLFRGDPIDTERLHVDCRVGDNFTSLGVFSRSSLGPP